MIVINKLSTTLNMKSITNKEFEAAESKMFELLQIATQKGSFDHLLFKERTALDKYTKVVKAYEDVCYSIPLPQTMHE